MLPDFLQFEVENIKNEAILRDFLKKLKSPEQPNSARRPHILQVDTRKNEAIPQDFLKK
jgi:hypothetical protein